MNKQTIKDVDWQGKKALVRVDFNVPLRRRRRASPTTPASAPPCPPSNYLLDHGAAVILMSHLGRPKGSARPEVQPAARRRVSGDAGRCAGDVSSPRRPAPMPKLAAAELEPGEILVLENTRFDARETKNEPSMGAELGKLGDVFVNDAFGSAHRAHASTAGVTEHLPAVGGFLMEKELDYLGSALDEPVRPFVAILGGAKVSDKIAVIEALLHKGRRHPHRRRHGQHLPGRRGL